MSPFSCYYSDCNRVFPRKWNLNRHLRLKHGVNIHPSSRGRPKDINSDDSEDSLQNEESAKDDDEGEEFIELEELFETEYEETDHEEVHILCSSDHEPSLENDEIYRKAYDVVHSTRVALLNNKKLLHPMHYFVVDLTGRHTPSTKALGNLYDEIQKQMNSKVEYKRYNVGITEENILLGKSQECTTKEHYMLQVLNGICQVREEHRRKYASEQTHAMFTFGHWVDATEPKSVDWSSEWGEITLQASSERRNRNTDPQLRAKIGQKCDYMLKFDGLSFSPELVIGELSGGIPAGANWKTWYDFLVKLVLGSRDCICRIYQEAEVEEGKEDGVVIYCFQLHGMKLKVFAVDHWKHLWRVAMVDECNLPTSKFDATNRVVVYSVLKGMFAAVERQSQLIAKLVQRKRKRPAEDGLTQKHEHALKQVTVVHSPDNRN